MFKLIYIVVTMSGTTTEATDFRTEKLCTQALVELEKLEKPGSLMISGICVKNYY